MSAIEILIADDHQAFRRLLRSFLEPRNEWHICGEAANGQEAVEKTKQLRPNVVLMDLTMPTMDGVQATRAIRQEVPGTKVIIVSQNERSVVRQQAAQAQADASVGKDEVAQELIPSLEKLFPDVALRRKLNQSTKGSGEAGFAWLEGGGEMGQLIRDTQWAETPLGPASSWSPALRMIVRFLLANRFPQLLWWGPEFSSIYNDAYIPILGTKHPWALGRPVREVWSEIWHILKPLIETPFSGGPATWIEDIPLEINRSGFFEETHFTIAYSPVPDESVDSGIGGVLATVHEITEKVVGERRVRALHELGARSVEPKSAEEACTIVCETLSAHSKDIPFLLLYLLDERRQIATLASSVGAAQSDRGCPKSVDLKANNVIWPLSSVLQSEDIHLIEDLNGRFDRVPPGPWSDAPTRAAVMPIRSNVQHQLAGFIVAGLSSRIQFDKGYRDFLELMSTQVATTIANARAYEEERRRAEALAELDRAKTAFFSNVSHEFRTPLTLMLGPLEDMLGAQEELTPNHRERVELVHRNSLRLLKLVNTLLDFSRIEAGRMDASYEPTDLPELTSELAGFFHSAVQRAGLRLTVHSDEIDEHVYVDREMWEKIVFNLLSNALKFTFAGEIEVSVRRANGFVELAVKDTGTGIPAEELPRLFERFHRVKGVHGRTFEGSGIGLALVRELTRLHGGNVRVESKQGYGSTFTVSIPLGKDHLPEDRIGAARSLLSTGTSGDAYVQEALRWLPDGRDIAQDLPVLPSLGPAETAKPRSEPVPRVLIADDNADMRVYLQRLLEPQYEVFAVGDGRSALESARQLSPDLVLADVMMPRLDGFGLLRELRADDRLKTIPVILLSARAGEESHIEGLGAGADDYLVKPFAARELLARVGSHLVLAQVRREAAELDRKLRAVAEREKERFQALVNATSYVVFRMNPDWSEMRQLDGKGFISDTGIPRKDWLHEYFHPEDHQLVLQTIREALRTKGIFQLEHRVRRTDGSIGWAYSRAVPLFDANGDIAEWFGAASDVTARKEAEENSRKLAETLDARVRSRTRELEQRNAEVLHQSEQVRDLSWRLLRIQDEERRHIARELHDSAGQTLTVLGINLAQLVQKAGSSNPELVAEAEATQEIVQQLHRDIRTASYLLHPPLLDESGLYSALSWYTQGLVERSDLQIDLEMTREFGRLPRDMELAVFRLVQECLTNIHRHSGSKTATIRIARDAAQVTVDIQDTGRGMSPERLAEIQSGGSGVGIRGMRERLRQFKGELKIDSDDGGTRISVMLPAPKITKPEIEASAELLQATGTRT